MSVLTIYTRLYADCASRAARGIAKSPWTLLLPMALMFGVTLASAFIFQVLPGIIGGLVFGLILDAAISSYLYFVGEVVSLQKVSVKEFSRSIKVYFWSVLNLFFVIWIARFVLGLALGGAAQGNVIFTGLMLVAIIALNATPEVIYLRGTYGGLHTIQASWEFLKNNWIEWFVPNVPLLVLVYFAYAMPQRFVWGMAGAVASAVVGGAVLHFVMVFRGQLFQQLQGSSHRQRMFRYRNP